MIRRHAALLAACLFCLPSLSLYASGIPAARDRQDGSDAARVAAAPEIDIPEVEGASSRELRRVARRELRRVRSGDGGPMDLADAAYVMENHLRQQGYPRAFVSFSMYQTTDNGDVEVRRADEWARVGRVVFSVRPGRRALVGRLTFSGVTVFSLDRVREFFPESGADEPQPFYRPRFTTAMREVSRLYILEGYADVEVGPLSVTEREESGRLYYDIEIPVTEGSFHLISEIRVSAPGFETEVLESLAAETRLKDRKYFPRQAATGAIRIRNVLGQDGYEAQVDYQVEFVPDRAPGSASGVIIRYDVEPGPPLVVRDIIVESRNQEVLRTRPGFIRSFVPLEAGDVMNLDDLNRTENRLYALGLFRFVDIAPEYEEDDAVDGDSPVAADIVISVTETDSRQVGVSAGWGSYEQAKATLSFRDRNIFGVGRYWSTSVYGSFKTYGAQTTISDSILFGSASTLSLTGSYDFRDAPAYDLTTIEGRLDFARRLGTYWRAEGSYSLSAESVAGAAEDPEVSALSDYRAARLTLGATRDDRNSVVLPTDGTEVGGRFQYSGAVIGSDLSYIEGALFSNYHEGISRRLTVTLAGSGRSRFPVPKDESLPISERLFLGGANSVRSFALDQLGPVGATGQVVGGLTAVEGTAELRLHLIDAFYLAGFYDLGFVSSRPLSIDGTIGQAVGGGMRYYLPIGPVRLDLAYNPVETVVTDGRWMFHFAVGFGY